MIAPENMYKNMYVDMKEERDTLIDDLIFLRAKIKRLEREKEIFHSKLMAQLGVNTDLRMSNKNLECENEKLKRKALGYDNMMTGEMGELYKKARAFDNYMEDK